MNFLPRPLARRFCAFLTLCCVATSTAPAAPIVAQVSPAPQGPTPPRLVVLLVVDQMRADYIDRFRHQWRGGLRRLIEDGAWFSQAAYPYLNTVTCVGHATISTGTFPATRGIVLNAWWDRESMQELGCTTDSQSKTISNRAAVKEGHSAARLLVPTFAEQLHSQFGSASRTVTFSLKPRSAIMLAGRRGDVVAWFEAKAGAWVTSSAYETSPVPFLEDFLKAHPVDNDFGKTWNRALPAAAYLFEDDAAGEKPPSGWTAAFPHALNGRSKTPDKGFHEAWQESPFSDAYLGHLAQAAVDALGLGRGPGIDFLGVGFSALDLVGHDFGPRSHEVQDMLVRLDATIGALLLHLDSAVGPGNYVVALTSDHGVAPIPEQMTRRGLDAGRILTKQIEDRVESALTPVFGPGKHVARMAYTDLYFAPGIYRRLTADPSAMQAVLDAILAMPGVSRVFRGEELQTWRAGDDRITRAAALSYYPGRSGDLIVVPKPYWFFVADSKEIPGEPGPPGPAATHGTAYLYDSRVPLILMGRGIKRGEYLVPATPADIAPTLGHLCGITLAQSDGRVLAEALEPRPRTLPARGQPTRPRAKH
jgi:predicted AlkP superfamily pyrophosphatase or phosphodiesterase